MKNRIRISLVAIALGCLGGCSNELFEGEQQTMNDKLTVTIPSVDTRMTMGGAAGKTPLWNTKDKISVFTQKESKYTNQEYTLSDGSGTKSGTFTGNCPEGAVKEVACYPWVNGAAFDGSKITLTMPATYTYKASNNNGAPMAAKIGNQGNIAFKNAGALVDIQLKNIPAGYDKVILEASGAGVPDITGSMEITFDANGTPSLKSVSNAANGKTITVSFDAAADFQDLRFYFPIPLGTYPELVVTLDNTSTPKPIVVKTFRGAGGASINVERGKLYTGEITIDKVTGDVPVEVATASGVKDKLAESGVNAVTVAAVSESDATVELPKTATGSTTPVSISFDKISTSTPVEVKEETSGTGNVAEVVTLGIPAPSTAVSGSTITPSLTVDLSNSTVKVAASEGTTTIARLIATTAENTLIIEKGVTVKELVIKGGNVKIYGTVEKISRDSDNEAKTTTVTTYEAGSIATVEGEAFTFKSVWDGTSKAATARADNKIYTAAELAYYQSTNIPVTTKGSDLTATMTAATTTLCADIDLNNKNWIGMVLGENATFDGGEHTISNVLVTEHILTENGKYTPEACVGLFAATKKSSAIKNITIDKFVAQGAGADAKWSGALVGYSYGTASYSNCHAKNVTIESDNANAYRIGGLIGFIATVSKTAVAVTVSNCSVDQVTIKGGHSLGGFIGTIQGAAGDTRTISGCTAANVTIRQNANSCALTGNGPDSAKEYAGNLSKFIGDTGSATIVLTDCTVDVAFSDTDWRDFGYNSVKGVNGEIWKLADATSPLIPAQAGGSITISNTLMVAGTNYNRFTLIKSGNNNAEGYKPEDGNWN